jgi:hypothetical protein
VKTGGIRRAARRSVLPPLLLTLALWIVPLPASAATTWHVTSSGDAGDGVCDGVAAGDCTLRDAVLDSDPGDTIVIDATYDPALASELAIDKDLTISGQGAAMTAVAGSGASRVLNIGSVTPGATVTISDLTVTGGHAPSGSPGVGAGANGGDGADGGAILNAATLHLADVTMSDNHAGNGAQGNGGIPGGFGGNGGSGGSGGAISTSGALTLTSSTFSDNTAGAGGSGGAGADSNPDAYDAGNGSNGGSGGAIAISSGATVLLTDSTLSDNFAGGGGPGGHGGTGIESGGAGGSGGTGGPGGAIANAGNLTADRSTLNGNGAGAGGNGGDTTNGFSGTFAVNGSGASGGAGGAISSSESLTVLNSTMTANGAGGGGNAGSGGSFAGASGSGGNGGAISSSGPTAGTTNATIAANAAGGGSPGGSAGSGGGVAGAVALTNTLVASNTLNPAATANSNCSGSPVDNGINLSYPAGTGCPGGTATDPLLGALANHGGPTKTMEVAPGSAAMDAVPATGSGCPATDQRLIPRPQGIKCDVGAFESRAVKPVITATDPASPGNTATPRVLGSSAAGTVSIYADAVCATGALGSGSEGAFASPGITVGVPADATTTLYASTVNADGTSQCSDGFVYANSIPQPVIPPPSGASGSAPTGRRAAALAKCKRKSGKARTKCKRKAKRLPI